MATKPLITIDLEEYNHLKGIEAKFNDPDGRISDEVTAEIMGLTLTASEENYHMLMRHVEIEYGVRLHIQESLRGKKLLRMEKVK